MRTVQTCILRLLIDPSEDNVLRGTLLILSEGIPQSFADEMALLALLRRLATQTKPAASKEHERLSSDRAA